MSDQLQAALVDILKVLSDSVKSLSATGAQELPQLVREYLAWGIASSWFFVGLGVFLIGGGAVIGTRVPRWFDEHDDIRVVPIILGIVIGVIGCIVIGANIYDIIQIQTAPRVYLLQQVLNLMQRR